MRRLPIYFLLDCSESMAGDPLNQIETGIDRIVRELRKDPYALETVYISVIGFAGIAKLLVPFTDLASFYPPRLPLGGGTNLSDALTCLMDDIDKSVVKTTAAQKGDWRPVIYLITDGKPTNDIREALDKWKQKYANRVTLIAIGVGDNADLALLSTLTPNVRKIEDTSNEEFYKLIQWLTASISAHSRSVQDDAANPMQLSADTLVSLVKDPPQTPIDESCVTFVGRCTKTKRPYLIKYEREQKPVDFGNLPIHAHSVVYRIAGCYPLTEDYFDWSDPYAIDVKVNTNQLEGTSPCPFCGANTAFAMCSCGKLMCINKDGTYTCPWCNHTVTFSPAEADESFDVNRSKG